MNWYTVHTTCTYILGEPLLSQLYIVICLIFIDFCFVYMYGIAYSAWMWTYMWKQRAVTESHCFCFFVFFTLIACWWKYDRDDTIGAFLWEKRQGWVEFWGFLQVNIKKNPLCSDTASSHVALMKMFQCDIVINHFAVIHLISHSFWSHAQMRSGSFSRCVKYSFALASVWAGRGGVSCQQQLSLPLLQIHGQPADRGAWDRVPLLL